MIISELAGGLGNQMFQYAVGRHLSILNNTELVLDTTPLSYAAPNLTPRNYALGVFSLPVKLNQQIKKTMFGKLINLTRPWSQPSVFKEESHRYNSKLLRLTGDIELSGYWQSEKYFNAISDTIRHDFATRTTPISTANANLLKQINNTHSISIHVRRGDFVTNKEAQQFHGVLSSTYYQQAVNLITNKIANPSFFVFSDDPKWVQTNLKLNYPITYVNHNLGENSHEDLRLMATCQHNIIANSSFSWWGAWLNGNKHKIVIAPQRWFTNNTVDTSDLIPNNWIKI